MSTKNKQSMGATIAGIVYIVLGLLCIAFRGGIISVAAYCAGGALIAFGIFCLVMENVTWGILAICAGAAVILIGCFMISILFYVIAILLIVVGIMGLINFFKNRAVNDTILRPEALKPILLTAGGVVFLFNQGGTVDVVFIIIGIIFIAAGLITLVNNR